MTKEEAITWLQGMLTVNRKDIESINMAIEALKVQTEQPEIIRCEDCLHGKGDIFDRGMWCELRPEYDVVENDFCSKAERRTDE